jgi:hypothetical protein
MTNQNQNPKLPKSIIDILNIGSDDGSFDDDEARKAKERQEERDAYAKKFKSRIKNLQAKDGEEYKKEMLKIVGAEGMEVLLQMKHEIEDNPSARGAECFATLMSSLTHTIDAMEKIDTNKERVAIDKQKVQMQYDSNEALINGNNNNVVMVVTTTDLLKMLEENNVFERDDKPKEIEGSAEKVEDDKEE